MEPVTKPQTCRVPRACDASELAPLLDHLASHQPVEHTTRFPRGTLTPDGRLDLCKQDIGPDNLAIITAALHDNPFVRSLLLGADFIGDAGSQHVARLLERNASLETVFLGCNAISPRGIERLCAAAETSPRLRGLWLKRNSLGSLGAASVARLLRRSTSLRTLDLANTDLGADGLGRVVRALADDNRALARLYVCGNALTAADAVLLDDLLRSPCPIEELYVSCNHLGDDGCRTIARAGLEARRLRVLGLASNGIAVDGAVALAAALRDGVPLTALELGQAPAMALLGASPNRIGDAGATRLAGALAGDLPLQRLWLGGNRIGALGGIALRDALAVNRRIVELQVGRHVPRDVKRAIAAQVERNRALVPREPPPIDVAQVRSVYRTHRAARVLPAEPPPAEPTVDRPAPAEVSDGDLAACARMLDQLAAAPEQFFASGRLRAVRASANRLIAAIVDESRRRTRVRPARRRAAHGRSAQVARDAGLVAAAGVRHRDRRSAAPEARPAVNYSSSKSCYICKSPFVECHAHYDRLCPPCAERNFLRRIQTADLTGQRALVTGGRIKIGHEVAIKLLEAGCTVFATTRFPRDAAERFGRHPGFARWRDRLHIIGIDLRDPGAVARLTAQLAGAIDGLEILINNAALTIHRPPGYYAGLIRRELEGAPSPIIHALTEPYQAVLGAPAEVEPPAVTLAPGARSAAMAGFTLVPGADREDWFPCGAVDRDGSPLDLRAENSWSASIEDVSPGELLEVHLVSSFAPFLLIQGLLPALRRSTARYRHIVNVSAMEGSFSRPSTTDRHPHTNMAKAALNMLTRTLAERLAADRILINSVDTGWVTDEQPHPIQVRNLVERNFAPPLDAVDGAARVCDPIFCTARAEFAGFGQFLKDYEPTSW